MTKYQTKYNLEDASTYTGQCLTPFQRKLLQTSLQKDLSKFYRQRIEIMLLADEGKSQVEIYQTLGCCLTTVRYWMNTAFSGMAHEWQKYPIGRPKAVNEEYLQRLQELLNHNPRDYGYAFQRWTANWLQKHLEKEFGISVSERHIKRLLKQMGLSTITKSKKVEENIHEKVQNTKIFIRYLDSSNLSDNNELWLINSLNLGLSSEFYVAKSTRSVSLPATVE